MKPKLPPVPKDFPVQPLKPGQAAKDRVTCGTCGRSWDDSIPTQWTPAPSARCPFEYYHAAAEEQKKIIDTTVTIGWEPQLDDYILKQFDQKYRILKETPTNYVTDRYVTRLVAKKKMMQVEPGSDSVRGSVLGKRWGIMYLPHQKAEAFAILKSTIQAHVDEVRSHAPKFLKTWDERAVAIQNQMAKTD